MKYFALIWENPSKSWQYYINDSDDLNALKAEIEEALKEGDIHPASRIEYYKGEVIKPGGEVIKSGQPKLNYSLNWEQTGNTSSTIQNVLWRDD